MEMADMAGGVTQLDTVTYFSERSRIVLEVKSSDCILKYPFRLLQPGLQQCIPTMYFINRFIQSLDVHG